MTDIITDTLPAAPEIERAVLAALFLDRRAITEAVSIIGQTRNAFHKPTHEIIWDAIIALHEKNCPVDQLSVADYLHTLGKLELVGGETTIAGIAAESRSTANIRYHCELLKEKALLRMLISTMTSARNACIEQVNPIEVANSVQSAIEIVHDSGKRYVKWLEEIMPDAYSVLQKWSESGAETFGVPSGFPKLDMLTGGWVPGRLIIIGGLRGDGKTALAMACAMNAADRKHAVLFFSLEMSHEDMAFRAQAMGMKRLLSPRDIRGFTQTDWRDMSATTNRLSNLPIAVVAYPSIPISVIGNMIESHVRTHKIGLVMIDYLQLVSGSNHESRRLEVESVSRKLKQFAGKYQVPIIALSQFSRKANESDDAEPQLSWLRESGSIEQDADQAVLLWNPPDKGKDWVFNKCSFTGPMKKDQIRLALLKKNRFGKEGRVVLKWVDGAVFEPIDYRMEAVE